MRILTEDVGARGADPVPRALTGVKWYGMPAACFSQAEREPSLFECLPRRET
jgi:hypothetical protein